MQVQRLEVLLRLPKSHGQWLAEVFALRLVPLECEAPQQPLALDDDLEPFGPETRSPGFVAAIQLKIHQGPVNALSQHRWDILQDTHRLQTKPGEGCVVDEFQPLDHLL